VISDESVIEVRQHDDAVYKSTAFNFTFYPSRCYLCRLSGDIYSFASWQNRLFLGGGGGFGPSSVKKGRTHIVLGYNMSGASTSTYPENLGSGGLIPAELGGRVCLFFVRHAPGRSTVYGHQQGIRPPAE